MTTEQTAGLSLGVCDYPEHVDPADWAMHAKQQAELGLTWVRLAEFCWAKIEPQPEQLNFQWLDEAIETYAAHGLQVVLGTPTATPPAWLIELHPEILPVDENGQVKRFGSRRHYDHASEIYRQHCCRIVTEMAKRYGSHPAVKGWQIDNELGHEGTTVSYGGASQARFPQWLENKYATLDELNRAWGNAFWSQDYTKWQQIDAPNLTAVRQANPSHKLDYQRYCSELVVEFQKLQIDIIRSLCPTHFITHNCVIFSAQIDLYQLAKPLDFVAWDSYPIGMLEYFATWETEQTKTHFARSGHPDLVSLNHDLYRGLLNQTGFWVMEQQCGHANWADYNPLPANGAVQLWTAQAWAHGAQSVMYFRFRASHMAQEIMHSGLLKQNAQPDRGYDEVAAINCEQFPQFQQTNHVAIVHDYDSLWSYDQQPHNKDLSYWRQFTLFYSALRKLGVNVDIIHASQLNQQSYRLIVCPALTLLKPELAQRILDASKHSQIIFGPRTDFRDQHGKAAKLGQLSQLEALVGATAGSFESLRPSLTQAVVAAPHENEHKFEARLWCESYLPDAAQALYHYRDGPLDGQTAVTRHNDCVVIGALSPELIQHVVADMCMACGVETHDMPQGVRITQCGSQFLLCNFNPHQIIWHNHKLAPVSYVLLPFLPND